jgi:hypothetical protein
VDIRVSSSGKTVTKLLNSNSFTRYHPCGMTSILGGGERTMIPDSAGR